ncbi:MAJOR FACILITATOR SUPERFAMILY DOMAIN-CONTAINING PROTEIN [Salix purpurea]|uniref:MAJOR FACILITATOR SUPERFAMILY DOMAIN-CONTAINING PROTEIN n=1 Tax=Salix purpurea TaxID=77065 RepID=A0A9Q1A2E7_SALPP|nr:MAJOR FACILITATOR SUPERFAMILY DOMAIN-CONTAINING PROTEIN [Salix purpurea]
MSSFFVSVIMQEMSWTGQRLKAYYSAGGILWVFCGAGILFLPRNMSAFMYVMSVFIGIANALMTVTGVSMQSILVGSDLKGCAFVYGSLSFLDKVSCGLAVFALQSFQSNTPKTQETLSTDYISVTRYGPGSASSCLFTCWGGYYIHYETPATGFKILVGTAAGMIYQSSQFVQKALTCSPHCCHLRTDPNARVPKARRFQAARRLLECRYTCTYQDGGSFIFFYSLLGCNY